MAEETLCSTCTNAIYCPTWSEWKCKTHAIRFSIYGRSMPTKCADYKKRSKDFKEPKCQCDDCLKNDFLCDEED